MTVALTAVDDPGDPRLVDYVGLRDPELRMRYEGQAGVFIVEGALAVTRLLESDYEPLSVLLSAAAAERLEPAFTAHGVTAPVYVAPKHVLEQVTGFAIHRGVVAAARRPPPTSPDEVLAAAAAAGAPVTVLERVNDHENLGALFRNAAAFGVGAVLLDPTCSDPLYRRAVRVSIGHVLHVPFARIAWPDGAATVRAAGYTVIALTPKSGAVPLATALERTDRPAFLLGAEGPGLSADALDAADIHAVIPMTGGVDSLNVATAAALAFQAAFNRR